MVGAPAAAAHAMHCAPCPMLDVPVTIVTPPVTVVWVPSTLTTGCSAQALFTWTPPSWRSTVFETTVGFVALVTVVLLLPELALQLTAAYGPKYGMAATVATV